MLINRLFHILYDADAGGGSGGDTGKGASGDANGNGSGGGAEGGTGKAGEKTVTLTQDALNAQFADRARRAGESATAELLKALGVKSTDEAKAALAEFGKLKAGQMSDLEKAQATAKEAADKLAEAERKAAESEQRATENAIRHAVEMAAAKLGFAHPEDAYAHPAFERKGVALKDGKPDGVDEALKALAKARPELIGKSVSNADNNASRRGQSGELQINEEEIATRYGIRRPVAPRR